MHIRHRSARVALVALASAAFSLPAAACGGSASQGPLVAAKPAASTGAPAEKPATLHVLTGTAGDETPCEQSRVLRDRAQLHFADGKLDRTLRSIEYADALCPSESNASLAVAVEAFAAIGRFREMRAVSARIDALTDAMPEAPTARAAQKRALARMRDLDRAMTDSEEARAPMRKALHEAMEAEERGDAKLARSRFSAAWQLWHPCPDCLIGEATAARTLGDGAEAQRLFDRAIVEYQDLSGERLELDVPNGFAGFVSSLSWSPGGRTFAVAHRSSVSIVDRLTLQERVRLRGHTGAVLAVAYSPDGRRVATAGKDGNVRIFRAENGALLRTLDARGESLSALAWSRDGRTLVSGGAEKVARVWDAETGALVATLAGHTGELTSVALTADGGGVVTVSVDRSLRTWSRDGRALGRVELPSSASAVALSPSGKLLAVGCDDHGVRLFELESLRAAGALSGHDGAVTALAFAPDGKSLGTASSDGTGRLWTLGGPGGGRLSHVLGGHSLFAKSIAFSPDGQRLAVGAYAQVRLWEAGSGKELATLEGHADSVNSLAISRDGRTLAIGGADHLVRTVRLDNGAFRSLEGHNVAVAAVAFSPTGETLASGGNDGALALWDVPSGTALAGIDGDAGLVSGLGFSGDGRLLLSASANAGVRLWDTQSRKETPSFSLGGADVAFAMATSPDGSRVAVGTVGRVVSVREIASRKELLRLEGHSGSITSVAWSSDGATLAVGTGDGHIRLWDAKSGASLRELTGHADGVTALAFRPGGDLLVSGSNDASLRLWALVDGKERMRIARHVDAILALAMAPDGSFVVSGGRDGSARVIALPSGQERLLVRGVNGRSDAYALAPTGHVQLVGDARRLPLCRVGAIALPFAACEERYAAANLVAQVMAQQHAYELP